MRIGVFGGTFDPVHFGHLLFAERAREQAALDRVLFVPAARPPHKSDVALTNFERRVEMLELAIAGYPPFQVSRLEQDRPGPNFTVDTLRQVHEQFNGDELFLLLGSDCLSDLPQWRDPAQIAALATLLVALRPGMDSPVAESTPFRWEHIEMPLIDISATEIRRRRAAGQSIRYLTPRAVECYIETHKLYLP